MIDRLLRVFRGQNPDLAVKAASLWDDEITGYVTAGVYVDPAKLLLVVTEEDQIYVKRFTPDEEFDAKNITGVTLKISGKPGKKVTLRLKGADEYYDPKYHGNTPPEKRSLRSRLKDGGIVLDSNYQLEQCNLGDAFPDETALIKFLTAKRK